MNYKISVVFTLAILMIYAANVSAVPSFYPYYQQQAYPQASVKPPAGKPSHNEKAQQGPGPVELLKRSIGNTLTFLSQPKSANYEEISKFVMAEMAPNFDFNYMSRWIAGRYYRHFNPEQKKQFRQTFKELFISTLVQRLSQFKPSLSSAEVFSSRRINRNEAIANVQIMRPNQQKINVDFRFIKTPYGWKVIDVKANGISALMYYRQYFSKKIKQRRN